MIFQSYKWRPGHSYPVSASVVAERVEEIRQGLDGTITPADLVADAKPKKSPLHALFEWRDSVAAALHREQQAADVLRALVVVSVEMDDPFSAPKTEHCYVGIGSRREGSKFTALSVALADDDLKRQVFADARRQILGLQRRLQEFQEAAKAIEALKLAELALADATLVSA